MKRGTVVSIGTFDGIHLGHRAILRELGRQAASRTLPSLVYAFSTPPGWVLRENEDRYLLLPTSLKLDLLRNCADVVHAASFESVRSMDPEEFVQAVLIEQLQACVVVEGDTFRFGRNRSGDLDVLRSIGNRKGLEVISVPPMMAGDEAVSSTRIRESIRSGDLLTARRCLGRSPILLGTVVRGDRLGTELGYPTANLAIDPHVLLPRPGVFLIHAYGKNILSDGLLYIGSRPTLDKGDPRCEVHLLGFPDRSLYGEFLEIHLLEKIRDDRAFPSLDALRSQIGLDLASARRLLSDYPRREERISS